MAPGPTTRMRLRKRAQEADGSEMNEPQAAPDPRPPTVPQVKKTQSKKNTRETKQSSSKVKDEVQTKSGNTTTRKRGKNAGEKVGEVVDTAESREKTQKPASRKGKGGERSGRNPAKTRTDESEEGVLRAVEDEPMDTDSDPASDDVDVPAGQSRAGGNGRMKAESSQETETGTRASNRKAGTRATGARLKREAKEEVAEETSVESFPIKRSRRQKVNVKAEEEHSEMASQVKVESSAAAEKMKAKVRMGVKEKKGKGKGKVKKEAEKETESTVNDVIRGSKNDGGKCVGAHCSIAGGLWKAVADAVSIGAKSIALFLRSQRQWQAKPLDDQVAARFREECAKQGFPPHLILPHGSYLLNCGSPNQETLTKSRDSLVDELDRCQKLGLTLYNFHPGSTCGSITVEECLDRIGESINMALAKTSGVTAVIENMSCQGNTVGGRFEELRGIIDRVKDKTRIGVCLDTCHAFAAGYDLSTEAGYQKMVADFEKIVGFKYLKGMHINDSKGEVGCHLDRHENIGRGKIGVEGFRRLMNDPRFDNIPLILETPPEYGYSKEITMLNSLIA